VSGFTLTARQRRSLEAICDTFAPGDGGLPSAIAHLNASRLAARLA
jgi:hypothetical protein